MSGLLALCDMLKTNSTLTTLECASHRHPAQTIT